MEGESRNLHATVLLTQISPLRPRVFLSEDRSGDFGRNDGRSFLHSKVKIEEVVRLGL
jgi:hypothetical protein